jgi:trehalose 6-phosphate phosphatase
VTDEHAFAAVASRGNPDDVTVKVGDGDTGARYRVGGPPEVTELLRELVTARRDAYRSA